MCTECITHSFWLVMNFFQHEMFITALFCSFCIPVNMEHFFIDRIAFTVKYGYIITRYDSEFTIVQDVCITCIVNDCWNIGSNEVFPFAKADNQWVFFFSTNDFIWFISTDNFKSVCTVNTIEHATYGAHKITIIHIF